MKTRRWIVGSIAAVSVAGLLFISPVLLFTGSNAIVGLYSLLFEKQPSEEQLIGTYQYRTYWGTTTLQLKPGNHFEESMAATNGTIKSLKGTWGYQSSDSGIATGITFRPYFDLEDETYGRQFDYGELNFYKPMFGQTYGEINGDTGARFIKQ
ncbi:MAG TPA: hypothetical protein VIM60_10680 [Edaphobacter sp.]